MDLDFICGGVLWFCLPYLLWIRILLWWGLTWDEDILDLSVNDPEIAAFNERTLIGFLVSDKLVNFKAIKAILLGV